MLGTLSPPMRGTASPPMRGTSCLSHNSSPHAAARSSARRCFTTCQRVSHIRARVLEVGWGVFAWFMKSYSFKLDKYNLRCRPDALPDLVAPGGLPPTSHPPAVAGSCKRGQAGGSSDAACMCCALVRRTQARALSAQRALNLPCSSTSSRPGSCMPGIFGVPRAACGYSHRAPRTSSRGCLFSSPGSSLATFLAPQPALDCCLVTSP